MAKNPPKGSITAGELIRQLNADPNWVAMRQTKDAEFAAIGERRRAAAAGLERELKEAGIEMKEFRYLKDRPGNYKLGIPILIRHMRMNHYDDPERNSMAQAIAMKEANPYWNELLELFLAVVDKEEHSSFKQGLAVALAASYKAPQFEMLVSLCENTAYGSTRVLLVEGLKRSRDPRAEVTLMRLCGDPIIGKGLTKWMKSREKRRNLEGRNNVAAFS